MEEEGEGWRRGRGRAVDGLLTTLLHIMTTTSRVYDDAVLSSIQQSENSTT